ncbi:MAG TPA: tetratricopeptide repeat protein [Steroidobacter sp.]|uniref:tetratricopeptide repeat protein n=1 Tax=Steroidobacter sp. TaxID=1978227 RepID=UPI002ED923DB
MKIRLFTALVWATLFVTNLASALDVNELRSKAEQGDAAAQYELALAYDAGSGVQKDLGQAANWCLKAAEQGHAAAQNCIGSMYQYGDGVPMDEAAAAAWYEKSAAQDYGEAYTNLGYLYDLGKGVSQDRARAVELYLKGAEKGSLNAMLNVGVSYWQGAGVAVDRVEAYKWLDLARFYSQRSENMQLKWRVRGALDELQKKMSKAEIREGKQRSKEWDASHRPR